MSSKIVYQTSPLGLYVGECEADESPLEPGVFHIPAGCVQLAPPLAPEGKAPYWNGATWELVDWHEGVIVYRMATGEPLTLQGTDTLPPGYTLLKPGPHQVWKDGAWVDDLEAMANGLYAFRLAEINNGCAAFITGGIVSAALGEPHRYSSDIEDQVNLTGLAQLGIDAVFACYPLPDGHKAWKPHTAAQLHQVGVDMAQHKMLALQHAEGLKRALAEAHAAQDLDTLQALGWSLPQ